MLRWLNRTSRSSVMSRMAQRGADLLEQRREIAVALHRYHRPEDLLAHHAHRRLHVDEHSRFVLRTVPLNSYGGRERIIEILQRGLRGARHPITPVGVEHIAFASARACESLD